MTLLFYILFSCLAGLHLYLTFAISDSLFSKTRRPPDSNGDGDRLPGGSN